MKKLVSIAAALLLCVATQAQIVHSRSSIIRTEKQASNTQWYLRGGLNMMKLSIDESEGLKSKPGYNFMYGFQKTLGTVGTYWGMEAGLGSRGVKEEEKDGDYEYKWNMIAHNIQVSPFTFGYKYNFTDNIAIDAHLGAYVAFDYAGKITEEEIYDGESDSEDIKIGDWEDWKRFDAGMNIGVGLWYDRFNFDITYQRGFIKTLEANTSNVLIRLGIAF